MTQLIMHLSKKTTKSKRQSLSVWTLDLWHKQRHGPRCIPHQPLSRLTRPLCKVFLYVHLLCHMYISIYYIPYLHTSKDMLFSKGTHFLELAFYLSPALMQLASTCIGAYLPAGTFHDVNFEMGADIWTLTSTS